MHCCRNTNGLQLFVILSFQLLITRVQLPWKELKRKNIISLFICLDLYGIIVETYRLKWCDYCGCNFVNGINHFYKLMGFKDIV